MKTSVGQASLKYVGFKICSDLPKHLKYVSPYSFRKQYKKALVSC